jgi:hypothetical protein
MPDNIDTCLVCGTEIPPGPDFCGPECEKKAKPAYFVDVLPDGRWAFYVDSSLLNSYTKCPKFFWYQYMQMQRRKGMAGAMSIGSWWSRTLELFYLNMQARQQDNAGYVTREEMTAFAVNAWRMCMNCKHEHTGSDSLSPCSELNPEKSGPCECKENRSMNLMQSQNPTAWKTFNGPTGALLMASEYYDRIGGLDNTNLKIVSSEAGFGLRGELILYEDEQIVIYYVGKPDLVVWDKSSQFLAPLDHKTVDRVRSDVQRKFKPHSQTIGYIWAVGQLAKSLGYDVPVDRCIINICGRLLPAEKPRDGKKKPRFTRIYPNYGPDEIDEWKRNAVSKVQDLYKSIQLDEWQMRDNSCHLYGGCDFRLVDSVAPVNRPLVLKSDYVTVEPWVPYAVEDEDEDGEGLA